jgi:hypothetical protein
VGYTPGDLRGAEVRMRIAQVPLHSGPLRRISEPVYSRAQAVS